MLATGLLLEGSSHVGLAQLLGTAGAAVMESACLLVGFGQCQWPRQLTGGQPLSAKAARMVRICNVGLWRVPRCISQKVRYAASSTLGECNPFAGSRFLETLLVISVSLTHGNRVVGEACECCFGGRWTVGVV